MVMEELLGYGKGIVFFVELLALVMVGRFMKDKLAGYELDEQLTKEDNPAVAISFAGYVFGLLLALSGSFIGGGSDAPVPLGDMAVPRFVFDLVSALVWGVFAIAALNVSRVIIDKFLLAGFTNIAELVQDRNIGVGVCEACGYVAAGLIIRASIAGDGAFWLALFYMPLGLGLLAVGTLLLRTVVFKNYKLLEEIEKDNHAAGVLFGLHILAVGYITQAMINDTGLDAASQQGITGEVLKIFAIDLGLSLLYQLIGMVSLAILALITDRLLLPKDKLQDEIIKDRNVGAGLISGVIAIGGAIVVMGLFSSTDAVEPPPLPAESAEVDEESEEDGEATDENDGKTEDAAPDADKE